MERRLFFDADRLPLPALASAVLAGDLLVQCLPRLPSWPWPLAASLCVLVLAHRWPRLRWIMWFLLACAWSTWRADIALQARLPPGLSGKNIEVTGQVRGLPESGAEARRFVVFVDHARFHDKPVQLHGRVHVSWYGHAHDRRVAPCSRWHLRLRLKRPRGLMNPGGFDSERSALQRGIEAVGYVRHEGPNRLLPTHGPCLDRWRAAISRQIGQRVHDTHDAHLLQALAVGDKRGLSDAQWQVARRTGVSHLLAISGFHIGIAALFGVLLVRLLWNIRPQWGRCLPRPLAAVMAGCLMAAMYAALAGFALPTLRALLMIATVTAARLQRRRIGAMASLAAALLVIVVADPLAVLSDGFWLSFAAVALLLLCLGGSGAGRGGYLHTLGRAQLVMTVALLPLTVGFFGQASPLGAGANLVAVPVVSLLVVPLTLSGTVLLGIWPGGATMALQAAARVMHWQWWMLAHMAAWPLARWYLPMAPWWALPLALLGALWLFAPRGMHGRWLGLALMLPLLVPGVDPAASGAFRATVLDVGQGLSIVVRTRRHALLFDAGAHYPSGFDLGEAAVVPALHALGVTRLDLMMISHGDNDHAGGAPAVARAFPVARELGGEPRRSPRLQLRHCHAGQHWQWDGVRMRVLAPRLHAAATAHSNDRGCVLLIAGRAGRLLLTGDITQRIEPLVARQLQASTPLVLQVPHHGSHTSSSTAFIHASQPELAIVSAGWHNRYGHPAPVVVARYRAVGVPLLNTATSGAVRLRFPANGKPFVIARWRLRHTRYWRE